MARIYGQGYGCGSKTLDWFRVLNIVFMGCEFYCHWIYNNKLLHHRLLKPLVLECDKSNPNFMDRYPHRRRNGTCEGPGLLGVVDSKVPDIYAWGNRRAHDAGLTVGRSPPTCLAYSVICPIPVRTDFAQNLGQCTIRLANGSGQN